MNLYLVPNDPCKAVFVSSEGVALYRITTRRRHFFGTLVTQIHRPVSPGSTHNVLVAEVEWKRWSHPVVKSDAFDGTMQDMEVREFLYKLGRKFST